MNELIYLTGFGNQSVTESIAGALAIGQNSPQRHPPHRRIDCSLLCAASAEPTPNRLRWDPLPIPDAPADFSAGPVTVAANKATQGTGVSLHLSPWIVAAEALAPVGAAQPLRPASDPAPHLKCAADQSAEGLDVDYEVLLLTPGPRASGSAAQRISQVNACSLYWTVALMVAHQSSSGCNLQLGNLFDIDTLGADRTNCGGLLEITANRHIAPALLSGEQRRVLEDGDEVILRAHYRRPGRVSIGFGECRGRILPARGVSA